jgi:hypothetical protein
MYHYQPGLQRYRCKDKDCKRTFNDLTGTLLDGSKRSLRHWILATFLLCLSCSSRRIAKELGVPAVLVQKTTILWKCLYLLASLKDSPGLGEAYEPGRRGGEENPVHGQSTTVNAGKIRDFRQPYAWAKTSFFSTV